MSDPNNTCAIDASCVPTAIDGAIAMADHLVGRLVTRLSDARDERGVLFRDLLDAEDRARAAEARTKEAQDTERGTRESLFSVVAERDALLDLLGISAMLVDTLRVQGKSARGLPIGRVLRNDTDNLAKTIDRVRAIRSARAKK